MFKRIQKTSRMYAEFTEGKHRFEHWLVDSQVYFITACCRDHFPAFTRSEACAVFWDRFDHYTKQFGFEPWATSLLNNHYHTVGFLYKGENLSVMMQRIHGSVAKLVNDLLPERRKDFWRHGKGFEYFDGCLRNALQLRRTHGYVLRQAIKARLVRDWRDYPNTHVHLDVEACIAYATAHNGFMEDIPYKRYER